MWYKIEIYGAPFDKKPLKTMYADSALEAEASIRNITERAHKKTEEERGEEQFENHYQEYGSSQPLHY